MSRKPRTPAELDSMAKTSLEYEVRRVICDAWSLERALEILRPGQGGTVGDGLGHNTNDALLDAWLIHVRLLNEFLYQTHGDDARAIDWNRSWAVGGFLTKHERDSVSRQVAHLSWERERWTPPGRMPPWDTKVVVWTDDCCSELQRFIDTVPAARRRAFEQLERWIEGWLTDGSGPPQNRGPRRA